MAQWENKSAYFNGDTVHIRLVVNPLDTNVELNVDQIKVGERATTSPLSICGVDDRVASTKPRVARIDPIGCTGWIIEGGQHLTAGHCLAGSGNNTLSFNPPASLPDGTVQFPGPEDQYSINRVLIIVMAVWVTTGACLRCLTTHKLAYNLSKHKARLQSNKI